MRYNFSPSLWILICLIFLWPYKRFNCNDICKNPDLLNYENVIIENDTYRYSLHYYYSMRIQRDQPQPVPSERFNDKIYGRSDHRPQFSFSFYGSHVKEIYFHERHEEDYVLKSGDSVDEFDKLHIGSIFNFIKNYTKSESWFLDEKELLGVQSNSSISVNGADVTATITSLIHPNGKISFYYDNVSQSMRYLFQQNGSKVVRWWSLKPSENTSTGIMEENKPHKSYWYLYVVIPLAASLFLICIGYIIWRWLLRSKNSGK